MRVRWVLEDAGRPGGVESVTRSLVDGLRELGHDAEVQSWFADKPTAAGSSPLRWLLDKFVYARGRARAASEAARRIRYDLLADPGLVVLLDPGSLTVGARLRGASRWGVHLHWSPDLLLQPWRYVAGDEIPGIVKPLVALRLRAVANKNRSILKAAPFVVTLTPSHTRMLLGLRTDAIELPNPARLEQAAPRSAVKDSTVRVAYLGRIAFEKGPDIFVEAAALLGSHDLAWLVGGAGPYEESLRQKIDELRAPVRMVGWVGNPREFLEHVDVLVLPSRTEAVPLVLAEALAAGCHVVAAKAGDGVRDVLGNGRLGRLVPTDDVSALAEAITATVADVRADVQPDRDAVARLVERHDPLTVLRAWEELLRSVGGRRS